MKIFPAVDIKNGQAVRLKKGLANEVTVFSDNPVEMALKWQNQGAEYLHIIDLDGAFDGVSPNIELVKQISKAISIPVQLGGGIRSIEKAKMWLEEAGVSRIIIGTLALEDIATYTKLCNMYPKQVGVSLDIKDGKIKSRGWVQDSKVKVEDIIPKLEDAGTSFLIYTDIERDGMQSGINLDTLKYFLELTKLNVIAAGGLHTIDDVKKLCAISKFYANLEGAITGRAIYEASLNLAEAVEYCKCNR